MLKRAFPDDIEKRKKEHLKIAVSGSSQTGDNGFAKYRFTHNALPEINFDEINTSTAFLGKKVNYPFYISCMTGGILEGGKLNKNLALAAEKHKIALGVGSQRVAIQNPKLAEFFQIRKYAPTIPVMANIGLVQLNYGFGISDFQKCVDMIEADALVIHLNPLQEAIQPEGNKNWKGLLPKLEKIVRKFKRPIIAKEVGCGLSEGVVRRLYNIGIKIFDTAGWGGTSWPKIEGLRGNLGESTAELFGDWGIPSAESIVEVNNFKKKHKDITILGSGGIRNGVEIAKAICLGADLVGIAAPFAKAGTKSSLAVSELVDIYGTELRLAMFGVGASNINFLKKVRLVNSQF